MPPPWLDSPAIDLDIDRLDDRAMPNAMLDEGRRLLDAVRAEMPTLAHASCLLRCHKRGEFRLCIAE